MTEPTTFKVAARRREPIPFRLEGSDYLYTFKPPKQASLMMPLMANSDDENGLKSSREVFAWLDRGLPEADQEHIRKRLDDDLDDLDFEDLSEVVNSLMEQVSGRPTS